MPQADSDRVLMALLELETDQDFAGPQNGQHAAPLPTLDKRIDMYIDAVWGPNGTATNEMRAIARDHLLSAMAADLAEQTTASVAALPQVSVFESRRVAAISKAAASDGALHRVSTIARGLAQSFLASVDGFTLRSLRLAALPLMALLVVASVWTTSNLMNGTDQSEQEFGVQRRRKQNPDGHCPTHAEPCADV